ncbi:hypothetical protein NQ024_05080, partial [Corynebacterium sp. 35RC1]|nr:hypothetical protein [Corynebacterium sp. 35RC1]
SGNETSGVGVDFDPNDPNFDFFDPCDGTTPEQKIAMGLPGEYKFAEVMEKVPYSVCDFGIENSLGDPALILLASDAKKATDLIGRVTFLKGGPESNESEIVWYNMHEVSERNCAASLSTSRGRVQVMYLGLFDDRDATDLCIEAETVLLKLVNFI